jgi:hypothetical protein
LRDRREELRQAALWRYWGWVAAQALAAAEDELARTSLALAEAQRRAEHLAVLRAELDAADRAAVTELPDPRLKAICAP